jgi:hypothetical protein
MLPALATLTTLPTPAALPWLPLVLAGLALLLLIALVLLFLLLRRSARTQTDPALIERLALDEVVDLPAGAYSHGQSRRLSMAMALVARPPLLLVDEPFDGVDLDGVDTITGFAAGTGADLVNLVHTATTATTADGAAAVVGTSTNTTLTTGAAAFALTGASSTTSDVVEITATLSSYGNLGLTGANSGIELLKALSSTDSAATSITATTADDDFYMVAYQNGNAYLYQVTNGADTAVVAAEIALVGIFNGVAAGAFASGDFLA